MAVRAATLAAGLTLAGASVFVLQRRRRREDRAVQRYFETMCRLDSQPSFADPSDADLPPLPSTKHWSGIAEQMRNAVWRMHRRARELEQTRTSLEVRCRRATAQAEQMRTIFSGLADPILVIDDYDEIVLINRSAEELFNIPNDKPEAKALQQLIHCQKLVQLLSSTRQRKAAVHRTDEVEISDSAGQSHWYRATAVKLASPAPRGNQTPWPKGPWPCSATSAIRRRCKNATPSSFPPSVTR